MSSEEEALQAEYDEAVGELFRNAKGGINCWRCGRFVGKDGDLDLYAAEGWEPTCRPCLDALEAKSKVLHAS
jgi:hypothetical protein